MVLGFGCCVSDPKPSKLSSILQIYKTECKGQQSEFSSSLNPGIYKWTHTITLTKILNFLSALSFFLPSFLSFYFWLRWVFIAARGLSLVASSGGYSSLRCTGFSLRWLLLLWSTGSRRTGFSSCGTRASEVVAHELSCSAACGIFPDQGSNPCPLHWQADS